MERKVTKGVAGVLKGTSRWSAEQNKARAVKMRGNQNSRKHGLFAAKAALSEWGREAIDGRSSVGRALSTWRADIVRDLGGEQQLSAQQRTVLDVVLRTKLLLDGVDGFLLTTGYIVNKKRKSLYPVVRERQALADSLVKHLAMLGLDRKQKPLPDVREYMAMTEEQRRRYDEEHPE